MADRHMLTTVDNPWSPLTHWDEWFAFDLQQGYNSPGLLARYAITSDELSEADQDEAIEAAIDEIIKDNPLGVSMKIKVP